MKNKGIGHIQNMKQPLLFVAIMVICSWTNDAFADAHCFCKLSCANLTNNKIATMVIKDYGTLATYTGPFQQSDSNQTACNTLCTKATAADIGSQTVANAACSLNCPNGSSVIAWSAVGTKEYKSAGLIGTLRNTPQVTVTTCKCPAGWTCNGCSPQSDGGITTDGKCKKVACQANTIPPYPPDGTPIGTWGFSWGNAFIAWGTTANGGAPVCKTVVTSPAFCKF